MSTRPKSRGGEHQDMLVAAFSDITSRGHKLMRMKSYQRYLGGVHTTLDGLCSTFRLLLSPGRQARFTHR